MTEEQIRAILEEFKAGIISSADALHRLRTLPFEDLGFANVDHHRMLRQGFPEVVFGMGKTVDQVGKIVEAMYKNNHNILVTRTTPAHFERVKQIASEAEFSDNARAIVIHKTKEILGKGTVMVVSAGTSDMAVAGEAVVTLKVMGNEIDSLYDVGVAGVASLLGPAWASGKGSGGIRLSLSGRAITQRGGGRGFLTANPASPQTWGWRPLSS